MSPTVVFSDVPTLLISDHTEWIIDYSHHCAAHDTGYGNFNSQRRYVETVKGLHYELHKQGLRNSRLEQQPPDDSTDNCQNNYERVDQLGPSQDDVYNPWEAYSPYSSPVPEIIPQTTRESKLDPLSTDGEIHDLRYVRRKAGEVSMVSDVEGHDESLPRTQSRGGIEYPTSDRPGVYSAPPLVQLSLGSGPMPPDGTTVVKNVNSHNITTESTSNSYNTNTYIYISEETGRRKKKKVPKAKRGKRRVPGCVIF